MGILILLNKLASRFAPSSSIFIKVLLFFVFMISGYALSFAEDKSWNAGGDQSGWFDDSNWLPVAAPTASDDTMINLLNASVTIPHAFDVKSVTLGGKKESTLAINNFVTGTVEPDASSDLAFYNRRDGHLILKGSTGKVTLKGAYKDSEEVIPGEPSFVLYVQ